MPSTSSAGISESRKSERGILFISYHLLSMYYVLFIMCLRSVISIWSLPFISSEDCLPDRFLQTRNLNLMHDAIGCHVKVFIYHILIIYCTYYVLKVSKSEMWGKVVTTSYAVSLFIYLFVWANKSRSIMCCTKNKYSRGLASPYLTSSD